MRCNCGGARVPMWAVQAQDQCLEASTGHLLTCQDLEVVLSFLKALQAPEALSHHQPERQCKVGEGLMARPAALD